MSLKRISYSKRAIKTDKGWFTGWDQFGAPKFIDDAKLAELAMPNLAKTTADKLLESKEYRFVKIVPAYFENNVCAIEWDGLEVIYEVLPSKKIAEAKKEVLAAIGAPCFEHVFKKPVYDWLRTTNDAIPTPIYEALNEWFSRFELKTRGDNVEVLWTYKNYLLHILNNSRRLVDKEYARLYLAIKKLLDLVATNDSYKTHASLLLNNKSEVAEYGKNTIIRYIDGSGDVRTLLFTVGSDNVDDFVYNTTINTPQIYICDDAVEVRIPDSWKTQAGKEKLRANSHAKENK